MTAIWTALLGLAVLWPARALSPFDGVPLSGASEAVVLGVVFPVLWWLNRDFVTRRSVRFVVAALVAVKVIGWTALPQHGLCLSATTAPFRRTVSTIAIDEPAGVLRSWDLRADAWAASPRCTAIADRSYASTADFPAWWRNLVAAIKPDAPIDLHVTGSVAVPTAGVLTIDTGSSMMFDGTIGETHLTAPGGKTLTAPLGAGTHRIDLHAVVHEGDWRFVPRWNGVDAWNKVRFTVTPAGTVERVGAPLLAALSTCLVVLLGAAWVWSCAVTLRWSRATFVWALGAATAFAICGASGWLERLIAIALVAAAAVPVAPRERTTRGAFMLIGVPWLALFVARAWPLIGRVTMFSAGDDWQMYQLAAYRIVMNGYWLEGGSRTFVFQPLYRWIVGVLHVTFGDSSVGEAYLDAFCLLAAALLVVSAVKSRYGFRAGVASGALTLVTWTVSPIWYLIGRSLSEIAGLGFMVAAAALLVRARGGSIAWAAAAGVCATLMFYTRLNHLLVTGFLLVWMLPLQTSTGWRDLTAAITRVPLAPVAAYASVVVAGLILFAARTWWYAGHFSLLYGTSFGAQQTGLQPSKIAEAVAAQLSMREPPALDPRSLLVVVGAVAALLAIARVPGASRLPAVLSIMTLGTIAGSLFAHTHDYPGRMSVHVVPFAVAMSVCAAAQLFTTSGVLVHE